MGRREAPFHRDLTQFRTRSGTVDPLYKPAVRQVSEGHQPSKPLSVNMLRRYRSGRASEQRSVPQLVPAAAPGLP